MQNALLKSLVAVSVVAFLFGASATANAFDDPFAERGTEYFYGEGASEHAAERAANDAASEWFTDNPHCEREKTVIIYNKWVRGTPSSKSVFDGRIYHFANQQGKQMFDHEPVKYVPALGGDCAVNYAKMGKRVAGNIRHAAWHLGRLFTFANAEGKKMFLANPKTYENADLAYGGKCIVCSVNMRHTVAGKPEYTVLHKGLRYLFPSAGPRDEFLANPEKYAVAANAAPASSGRSSSRLPAVAGSSTR